MTLKENLERLEQWLDKSEQVVKECAENLLGDMSNYYKEREASKVHNAMIRINNLEFIIGMLKDKRRKK